MMEEDVERETEEEGRVSFEVFLREVT